MEKNDQSLYLKLPDGLKKHATEFAKNKGGLSKLVRDLLIKRTRYGKNQQSDAANG